jgi:sterol desaturase/sphingolipid hydroxylase (fatty acid hydroxylase superfamily)
MAEFLKIVAVALITHYTACLIQMALHARIGHARIGGKVFRTHTRQHHAHYQDAFTAPEYAHDEESITHLYVLPVGVCGALALWLLPITFSLTVIVVFLLSFTAHAYLHVQFHLDHTPWERFTWFRRRQYAHWIHHDVPSSNFGVIDSTWDRVFGTYRDEFPDQRRRS